MAVNFQLYFQRFGKLISTDNDFDAGEKLIRRPNIHQGTHLHKCIVDYTTLRNAEGSVGETCHKDGKDTTENFNNHNLGAVILVVTARKYAIKSVAFSNRDSSHPELTATIDKL